MIRFNRGKFNVSGGDTTSFICDVKSTHRMEAKLSTLVKLERTTLSAAHDVTGRLSATLAARCLIQSAFSGVARPKYLVNLGTAQIAAQFSLSAPTLRTTAYDYIDLKGIALMPGETLEIDTENMTVTINGKNAVQHWQLGSKFFELAPGENTFIYYDTGSSRKAALTVTWRDRWL